MGCFCKLRGRAVILESQEVPQPGLNAKERERKKGGTNYEGSPVALDDHDIPGKRALPTGVKNPWMPALRSSCSHKSPNKNQ